MDVTLIVKQMIEKGASEQEIKNSLSDLGVENVDEVYQKAKKEIEIQPKTQPAPQPSQQQPQAKTNTQKEEEPQVSEIEITQITSDGEKKMKLEDIMKENESTETNSSDTTALLKSIQELNKKILETNREILLKLKLRE
jgi:outer membrane biosynthesis protein TonB